MIIFFDIHTLFFTLWGYPVSYIEFFGVVSGGLSTWLVARNNVWSWPVAVISVVLFFFLFYQIRLYPDMLLQIFFLFTYLRGWWRWTHPGPDETLVRHSGSEQMRITQTPTRQLVSWLLAGLLATLILGTFARNLHTYFPVVFSQPGAFPYLDSFTTVMSIVGTFLMIEKRLECWYVWLGVDAISTYIYFAKDIKLVSAEYFVFCFIAALGIWNWTREYRSYSVQRD